MKLETATIDNGPRMELPIGEKASDVGAYTYLGETIWVDDIIDPVLVKEIRTFVPEYVPLLTKRRYRTPAGTEIERTFHVIGRYIKNPNPGFEVLHPGRVGSMMLSSAWAAASRATCTRGGLHDT